MERSQKLDLVGLRFGRLQVISDAGCIRRKGHSYHYYQCRCDCGNEPLVMKSNLIKGYTNSCGCLRQEVGRILMKERRKWEKLMKEEKARLVDKAYAWWSRELREVNYETYDETMDAFRKAMEK